MASFIMKLAFYVFCLGISGLPTGAHQTCPEECKCFRIENGWKVDCSRRSLQDLPDLNNMEIKVLDLSGNFLSEFPRKLKMSHLIHLNLAHNDISHMQAADLIGFTKLISLDLSYNNISGWQNLNPNYAFQGATQLKYLYLNGNRLHTLTDENANEMIYSSSLQELYLEDCAIHTVNTSSIDKALPKIEMISFSGNDLGNDISLISTHLMNLDLSNCNIERIETPFYRGLPKLEILSVSGNLRIQVCDDYGNTLSKSLSSLDMSHCSLEDIHINCLPNLHEVNLRKNELKSLHPKHFVGLSSLSLLDLSHNQINNIQKITFKMVESLTSLDLSFNSLSKLDEEMFILHTKLVNLSLSPNKFEVAPLLISASLDEFILKYCTIQGVSEEIRANLEAIQHSALSSANSDINENRFASLWSTTFLGFPNLTSLKLNPNISTSSSYESLLRSAQLLRNVWLGNELYHCSCDLHQESLEFMEYSVKIHLDKVDCIGSQSPIERQVNSPKLPAWVIIWCFIFLCSIIYICFCKNSCELILNKEKKQFLQTVSETRPIIEVKQQLIRGTSSRMDLRLQNFSHNIWEARKIILNDLTMIK